MSGDAPPRGRPWAFWGSLAVGWGVIAFGVWGLLAESDATNPPAWAAWTLGGVLGHDLLLAPVVLGAGVVVARVVPARVRAPVQAALVASGLILLVAFPFLRGYGERPGNPSHLPGDYAVGTAALLGVVWGVAVLWAVLRRHR